MSFQPKVLAEGVLTTTLKELYRVPEGKVARITSMVFFNTTGATHAIDVYLNPSGTDRQIDHQSLGTNVGLEINNHILEQNDAVRAVADANNAIDYIIEGLLEDA